MTGISIVTPCLNAVSFIGDCIQSVANQSVSAQHVIVDGYSEDGTLDAVRALGPDVRVLQQSPAGIYTAINAGIEASDGEIIGILNADDLYPARDILERVFAVFEDASVDGCYGDLCYVDSDDPTQIVRYWRAGAYRPGRFRQGWMPPHPTFFVRRRVYEEFGYYRSDLGTAADYELMLRFAVKHGISLKYVPGVLVHMRVGGASNVSLRARMDANRMDRRAWQVNGLRPLPWTTLAKPLRKIGQWLIRPDGN